MRTQWTLTAAVGIQGGIHIHAPLWPGAKPRKQASRQDKKTRRQKKRKEKTKRDEILMFSKINLFPLLTFQDRLEKKVHPDNSRDNPFIPNIAFPHTNQLRSNISYTDTDTDTDILYWVDLLHADTTSYLYFLLLGLITSVLYIH